MARQLLSALAEAHRQGVIHRDLKPQNVMVTPESVPLIMDFGIARSERDTSGVTETGAVIGTPDYMSPEQGQRGKGRRSVRLVLFRCHSLRDAHRRASL